MFNANFYIDSFQNTKKQMVDIFVKHDAVKEALKSFVDSQTAYTKAAVQSASDIGTRLAEETVKSVKEASQIDFSKFDLTKIAEAGKFDFSKYFTAKPAKSTKQSAE